MEHLYTKSEFIKHASYIYGKYFVGIRLPSNGIVICQVKDSLGTYTKHKEIVGRGKAHHFVYKIYLIALNEFLTQILQVWNNIGYHKHILYETANKKQCNHEGNKVVRDGVV